MPPPMLSLEFVRGTHIYFAGDGLIPDCRILVRQEWSRVRTVEVVFELRSNEFYPRVDVLAVSHIDVHSGIAGAAIVSGCLGRGGFNIIEIYLDIFPFGSLNSEFCPTWTRQLVSRRLPRGRQRWRRCRGIGRQVHSGVGEGKGKAEPGAGGPTYWLPMTNRDEAALEIGGVEDVGFHFFPAGVSQPKQGGA